MRSMTVYGKVHSRKVSFFEGKKLHEELPGKYLMLLKCNEMAQ